MLLRYTHSETDDPTTQLVNSYLDKSGGAGFLNQVSAAGRSFYGRPDSRGKALAFFFSPPDLRDKARPDRPQFQGRIPLRSILSRRQSRPISALPT